MAQYSLFVLKVPLNSKQINEQKKNNFPHPAQPGVIPRKKMDRLNETKVEINSHYCCDPAMGDTILRTPGINVSVKKNACVSVMPHFEEDILALTT